MTPLEALGNVHARITDPPPPPHDDFEERLGNWLLAAVTVALLLVVAPWWTLTGLVLALVARGVWRVFTVHLRDDAHDLIRRTNERSM